MTAVLKTVPPQFTARVHQIMVFGSRDLLHLSKEYINAYISLTGGIYLTLICIYTPKPIIMELSWRGSQPGFRAAPSVLISQYCNCKHDHDLKP